MKAILNVFVIVLVLNGVFGAFCVVIYFLNSPVESSLLIYGVPSVLAAVIGAFSIDRLQNRIDEAEKKSRKPMLSSNAIASLSVGAGILVTVLLWPDSKPRFIPYEISTPVSVSEYQRGDGTTVSGYNRAESGDRRRADIENDRRREIYRRNLKDYEEERTRAIVIGAIVLIAGLVWSSKVNSNK
jgi:hypothetical protein